MAEKNTWNKTNQWSEELDLLHSIVQKKPLALTHKWGGDVYTYRGKNLIGLAGFKNYFCIWFFNGVFLKDEAGVLVNAQESVTKAMRQWRFERKEDVDEKLVLRYLQESMENQEKGLVLKPKKKVVEPSSFFTDYLKADKELKKAFDALTLGKQKEYIEYIDTAKQEKTKLLRFDKSKPLIQEGIGLNDKYKK